MLATGQHATVHMHEVSDQSEIMDRLGVSASAAVNSTFGSVSGQASFAKSANVSSKSTTLLLKATVTEQRTVHRPRERGLCRQESASRRGHGRDTNQRTGLHDEPRCRDGRCGQAD